MANKQMAKAEGLATETDTLDLGSTALIGIVGKTGEQMALLRNPDGSIDKVGRGDKTKAGKVVGIDAQSVSLQSAGRVRVLKLPKS